MKNRLAKLYHSRKFYFVLAALVIVALLPLVIGRDYIISEVLTPIIIFAIYASSWNLLAYSGQGSLGHAAFLGIGGFVSALIARSSGFPPLAALLVGSLFSALIGFFIGLTCVRLKAWFLAMVTFGFSVIIGTLFSQFDAVTQAVQGFPTPLIAPRGLPFFYMSFAIAAVSILSIYLVMKSKMGLAFKAIRENELEAKMIGINTAKYRLLAFVLSTFFAGLAGGLYAQSIRYIQLEIFSPYHSFQPLMMSVIGGLSTIEGPIMGSAIIVLIDSYLYGVDPFLQTSLGPLFPAVSNVGPYLRYLGIGLFLIVVVIFAPRGVTSFFHRLYNFIRTRLKGTTPEPRKEPKPSLTTRMRSFIRRQFRGAKPK